MTTRKTTESDKTYALRTETEALLNHMKVWHGVPECFEYNGRAGFTERLAAMHDEYHDKLDRNEDGSANFGGRAPEHRRETR